MVRRGFLPSFQCKQCSVPLLNNPRYGAESSSLVVLKPGHLLLLGDGLAPSRRHVGVIISYDPENPEGRSWTWRIVPVSSFLIFSAARFTGNWKVVRVSEEGRAVET